MEPPLEMNIEQLQALVEMLQKQLKAAGVDPDTALLSLSDIKINLQKAVAKLMEGDERAQPEFDKWERIMSSHPEHIEQLEKEDSDWETAQRPLNLAALQTLRRLFPTNLTNCNKNDLEKKCGLVLATRITRKATLRMLTMETTFIAKLHAADLICKYAFNGLDLRETRALYAAMPPEGFQNDGDGRKSEWGYRLREKLKGMTTKETAGSLRAEELIARDYPDTTATPKKSRRNSTIASSGNEKNGIGSSPLKGRRGSIASMLEGKIGAGKKGSGKKNKGNNKKKDNSAFAAMFAGRKNPNSNSKFGSPGSSGSSEEKSSEKENNVFNRRRFSAGQDNKVAWRAASSVTKQRRTKGKQVMKLASAFKQAQSALNQMMTNKKEIKKKSIPNSGPDTTEAPKRTASSLQETKHSTSNDVTMSTVAKSRKVVNQLEELLDSRQKKKNTNKAKRKLSMDGTTTTSIHETKTNRCGGLFIPWYLVILLVVFAMFGISMVGFGVFVDDGTTVVVNKLNIPNNIDELHHAEDTKKTEQLLPIPIDTKVEVDGAFSSSDVQRAPLQLDTNRELHPVTANRKKGKCANGGNRMAGCVYTADRIYSSSKNAKDEESEESEENEQTQETSEPPLIVSHPKKRSSYREWQLKKRKEEEESKRTVREMNQNGIATDENVSE